VLVATYLNRRKQRKQRLQARIKRRTLQSVPTKPEAGRAKLPLSCSFFRESQLGGSLALPF
jgi:hypothetical protein